eukprot:915959-Alexandrium_andersonii.AAC.2
MPDASRTALYPPLKIPPAIRRELESPQRGPASSRELPRAGEAWRTRECCRALEGVRRAPWSRQASERSRRL